MKPTLRILALLGLAACEPDAAFLCDDTQVAASEKGDFSRERGFVSIDPATECPDEPDLGAMRYDGCCPLREPKASCGFLERFDGVLPPYETSDQSLVTVCIYDAVFEIGEGCCS